MKKLLLTIMSSFSVSISLLWSFYSENLTTYAEGANSGAWMDGSVFIVQWLANGGMDLVVISGELVVGIQIDPNVAPYLSVVVADGSLKTWTDFGWAAGYE